jgi:hypothetical protein
MGRFLVSGTLEGAASAGDLAALVDIGVQIADVDAAEASEGDRRQGPRVHEVLDITLGDAQSVGDLLGGQQQSRGLRSGTYTRVFLLRSN